MTGPIGIATNRVLENFTSNKRRSEGRGRKVERSSGSARHRTQLPLRPCFPGSGNLFSRAPAQSAGLAVASSAMRFFLIGVFRIGARKNLPLPPLSATVAQKAVVPFFKSGELTLQSSCHFQSGELVTCSYANVLALSCLFDFRKNWWPALDHESSE